MRHRFHASRVELVHLRGRLPQVGKGIADQRGATPGELLLREGVERCGLPGERLMAPAGPVESQPPDLQRGVRQQVGVATLRDGPQAGNGLRVVHREASQHIEHERGVAHATCNRADHFALTRQWHHAGARHQCKGRLDAQQCLRRSRVLDRRPAGFLGEAQHRHRCRDGGGRPRRDPVGAAGRYSRFVSRRRSSRCVRLIGWRASAGEQPGTHSPCSTPDWRGVRA